MFKLLITLFAIALSSQIVFAADIYVFVRGAISDQGIVHVKLQAGGTTVDSPGLDFKATDNFSVGGEIAFLFQNVAPGTYYVAAAHDTNKDNAWQQGVDGYGSLAPIWGYQSTERVLMLPVSL